MSKLGIFLILILIAGLAQSGVIWWVILTLIVIAALVLYLVYKITESKKYQAMTDPHILYQDECFKNTPPYIGNKRTKVAHVYYCKDVENINPENQVRFPNMQEALFRGYTIHSHCHD